MDLSDEFLVESKTARDQGLIQIKSQHSEERVLNKVKSLLFAVWNGVGRVSRQQLADFYEVPVATIDTNHKRHRDEFDIDGVQVLEGNALKEVRVMLTLTSSSPKETVYTPAGVLRMGFILRDSQVAKTVRTVAISFIQGVGHQISSGILLRKLVQSHPLLNNFTEGQRLKISAPYARYWENMKSTLARNHPDGGIPGLSKDDIRKDIQFLSTYTDEFKLQGIKELPYKLASSIKGKYPDLISEIFNFETDTETKKAVIMFQFDKLIIDIDYVERCIGRGYLETAKESLGVDKSYLVFVAPFGATSYAEDHIRRRLVSEHQGCVGILTVQDLANFLYSQAISTRRLGTAKGEINAEFKQLLNYSFPEPPALVEQLSLFDDSGNINILGQ